MTTKTVIAGFGGQGILFAGKFLAYSGLMAGKEVSWLPSYGPEMRGGTANCSVIISDDPVGSPIIPNPDVAVVMNLPSYDKYEAAVAPGGQLYVDSTLIDSKSKRDDISVYYIPATKIATDNGVPTLANMIILGMLIKHNEAFSYDYVEPAMKKVVSEKRKELFDLNLKAVSYGYNYEK